MQIRFIVVLGVVSLLGVIAVQVYWAQQTIRSQEQQFGHSVQLALRNVVDALCEIDGQDFPSINPIERVSNNYFVVHTNNRIALDNLEYLLEGELQKRSITQNFEYGVYDCQSEQMVYGDLVTLSESTGKNRGSLPQLNDYDYYFGVYFPDRESAILWSSDIWQLTTGITVVIFLFFAYAIALILKQKRLSTIQRDFVNNITHELKTPVATLKVASGVLSGSKEVQGSGRISKYAQLVATECDRLEGHVNQLLRSALVENHPPLHIGAVDLTQVVKETLETFEANEPTVTVHADLEQGCIVRADPYLVQVVVYNLIDNAYKYGRSQIHIKCRCLQNSGELSVRDDGDGIPEKERQRVFRKFYRVSKGNKHDVKGFGLGLFVVKQAVKRMRGSIRLYKENTFFLTLPRL